MCVRVRVYVYVYVYDAVDVREDAQGWDVLCEVFTASAGATHVRPARMLRVGMWCARRLQLVLVQHTCDQHANTAASEMTYTSLFFIADC